MAGKWLAQLPQDTQDTQDKITVGNASRVYNFTPADPATITADWRPHDRARVAMNILRTGRLHWQTTKRAPGGRLRCRSHPWNESAPT